ncbi:trace amine-associated receptor 8a-like [Chanos chanos]|uniref:Trace amine-associated receptor 8a-like n=1 Tax=Chanos chanos TaxID=29144 RepID=A0A6J2WUU6_CHACN|nr:trace amine-associated receptor 8a-like [Chanos chanos]
MESQDVAYCYPSHNTSCTKDVRSGSEYIFMYIIFFSLSALTVFLNLLVIISVSHFKQLHTPTNMLVLSLAVADMIVGLFVMPVEGIRLIETCWYFGEIFCSIFPLVVTTVVSGSLGNLIFISIDRYIAVSDPLLYSTKVTIKRVIICISVIWLYSLIYSVAVLSNHMFYPETRNTCYGECLFVSNFTWAIVDLILSLISPCTVVISLYLRIYCVAKYQAQVINSITTGVSVGGKGLTLLKSERKAAKTLGIVVFVYLLCWIPYYINGLSMGSVTSESVVMTFLLWLMYMNSCMNPLIYALFYPWFKISTKHIITLRIFDSSSSYCSLFTM